MTLLVPLARLVMKRGLSFGELAELLKRAYVEAARRHFSVPGQKLTISRIAVLTGLTRKEASRIVWADEIPLEEVERGRVNRAARVMTAWAQESDFQDARGTPASLPFDSEDGPSVSEIVRRHGADVTPRAVLDELVRVGVVRELKNGTYKPVERAYIPHSDPAEKLSILGTDVADLIASIDHNLGMSLDESLGKNLEHAQGEPFYQRKVAYDRLPAEYLPELRALVRREAQALLERLDREMSVQDQDDSPQPEARATRRAMIGIYYFEEEERKGHDEREDG
jgi:hypothetical protein